MNYRLRLTPAAETDIDDTAAYIAQRNVAAALQFYDAAEKTLQSIRLNPMRAPRFGANHPRLAGVRKRAIDGFRNHLVFYRVENEAVLVIRVLHGARHLPALLLEDAD